MPGGGSVAARKGCDGARRGGRRRAQGRRCARRAARAKATYVPFTGRLLRLAGGGDAGGRGAAVTRSQAAKEEGDGQAVGARERAEPVGAAAREGAREYAHGTQTGSTPERPAAGVGPWP